MGARFAGAGLGAALLLAFVLVPAPAGRNDERPSPARVERLEPEDERLLRLLGRGDADAAYWAALAPARGEGRRSCAAIRVLAAAAARTGRLDTVTALLGSLSPGGGWRDYLAGLVASEDGRHEDAWRRLAAAVAAGVPCTRPYLDLVDTGLRLRRWRPTHERLVRLLGRRPDDALLALALAVSWDRRGRADHALAAYRRALLAGAPPPATYGAYARVLVDLGRYRAAAEAASIGIAVARRRHDGERLAELAALRATALDLAGDREGGRASFRTAIDAARRLEACGVEATLWLDRALLLASLDGPGAARAAEGAARRCEARLVARRTKAAVALRRGRLAAFLGERAIAEEELARAAALARADNRPLLALDADLVLLLLRLDGEEAGPAVERLQSLVETARGLEDARRHAAALSALGTAHERTGAYEQALVDYRRALALFAEAGLLREQSLALHNLALVHLRRGEPVRALATAVRAAELGRRLRLPSLEATTLQALAVAFAGTGQYEAAARTYRRALDAADRIGAGGIAAMLHAGLGRVRLRLGEPDAARQSFREALRHARETGHRLIAVQALTGLGLVDWLEGDLSSAIDRFEEGRRRVEALRRRLRSSLDRIQYQEARGQIYENLAGALLERAATARRPRRDWERAFVVVEDGRAQALRDALAGPTPRTAPSVDVLQRRVLAEDEILVELAVMERRSYAWLVGRDLFEVIALPPRRVLESETRRLLAAVAAPPDMAANAFGRHVAPARALWRSLLAPVWARVEGPRHWIVSPDEFLHLVPFEALVVSEPGAPVRYLVEDVAVSYTPSAGVLAELRERPATSAPRAEILVVGHSGADAAARARIPFAAEEARRIAGLAPLGRARLFLDEGATEAAIRRELEGGRFRIVHFAAHALADPAAPRRSAIFLEPADDDDGRLAMEEILSGRVDADLVVLSGCETAVGRVWRAEGVLGLGWAFLSAGASSLVVSLWSVNDRSTAALMESFYRELAAGGTAAAALAAAKRRLLGHPRRAYRHPFYWAPFVLVGPAPPSRPLRRPPSGDLN